MKTLTLAAALALAATAATAQTRGVDDDEIRVGGAHDMSGVFAGFSVPAVAAANMVFDRVNEAGGIHGRQIRYIVEDHGYQVPRAVQAVNKLVNRDEVFAMLLSLGTPHNLAAFRVLDAEGIPNVSPLSAARQMLDEPVDLKWVGTASYYDSIRAAVGYLAVEKELTQLCSMYIPSDFGTEIQGATVDEAAALDGVEFVAETTHRPDETDFTGAIGRLRDAGCELVTIAVPLRATITAVATAKQLGWDDVTFLVSSAGFHTAVAKVPGGVTDGLYAGAGWQDLESRLDVPEVQQFVADWNEATGEEFPGTGALLGYSAAEIFVRALEAAGPDLTVESFQAAMDALEFEDAVAGNYVDYSADDHQGADEIFISKIEGGSWALVAEVPTE